MSLLKTLFAPKVRLHVVIQLRREENAHFLQNALQSLNIPGIARRVGNGTIEVEWEGRQTHLQNSLNALRRNPLLFNASIVSKEEPYLGEFSYFSIAF